MAAAVNRKGLVGWALVLAGLAAAFALSFGKGCDETASAENQAVKIGDRRFFLEVADTHDKRMRGLGGRTDIPEDGGMLFVFPALKPGSEGFVMRDCPVDIDIIYLDRVGRIVTMHQMKAEKPRGPDEGEPGTFDNAKYENRLPSYTSRYPYQYVIELKGGTLPSLPIKEGDKIELPLEKLKARAK